MHNSYLIDGYNLLHAVGIFPTHVGPHALEKARGRLLTIIADAHKEEEGPVTVVFDARKAPGKVEPVQQFRQVEVLFAVKYDEADDLIEERIRRHSTPRHLIVVSDDRRLQQAARRRSCQVLPCAEYLDWISRRPAPRVAASTEEPEKQEHLTESEVQHWLNEFRDLANDPAFREINPFDLPEGG